MNESRNRPGTVPLLVGVGLSATLLVGLFISEFLLGRFELLRSDPQRFLRDFRFAIFHCIFAGYLPAAFLYVLTSAKSSLLLLRPILDSNEDALARPQITIVGCIGFGILGVILTALTPYLSADAPWNPSLWSPEIVWHRILGPLVGWFAGCLCYAIVKVSIRISRIADLLKPIDLLDLSPLLPFVHQGVRNVLLIVGTMSILSFFLMESGMLLTVVLIEGIVVPIAIIGLILPVRGVRRHIREAKQAELAWALKGIHEAQLRLKDSSGGMVSSQMADLITYYRFIDEVPEWPFRISTFVRVILYLLIPLASWAGGLLVELFLRRLVV
jgi:hypothetical protein